MIERELSRKFLQVSKSYPVVALMGPRQSGKTTLSKSSFPNLPYVSLENLDTRNYATQDPRGFLGDYRDGAILDEAQRVPSLFSYIQTAVDEENGRRPFLLTGSQNFMLLESLSQSLAGRVALLTLLPFSYAELKKTKFEKQSLNSFLFQGMYPRIYDKNVEPSEWIANYIQTYLERDVRLIKNVGSLSDFSRFLKMCASRAGQLLNLSSLANDCGINHNTAKSWMTVLEASYIVYLLQPHHKNFNKRLKKSPKLYFYDSGVLCSLLGVKAEQELSTHAQRGSIFESFIVSEILKSKYNRGERPNLYFWQDKLGREVDLIIEEGAKLIPVEIKAGKTVASDYFDSLNFWNRLSGGGGKNSYLIYAGEESQKRNEGNILSWRDLEEGSF